MHGVDYLLPSAEAVMSPSLPVTETDRGTYVVHGKKIFRAGTFADSTGTVRTWTIEQLDQMISNFHDLRLNGHLVGVPLRIDHTFSARDLVGWISDVFRIGEFLHADLHFTEWEAFRKWERGTFGPVSSEVAPYETNKGDIFFPTLIGVAFVDIPAVEGLYRASGVSQKRITAVPVESSMLDSQAGSVYERGQEAQDMGMETSGTFDPELAKLTTAQLVERGSQHQAPVEGGEGDGAQDPTVDDASGEGAADAPAVDGTGDGAAATPDPASGDQAVPPATEQAVTEDEDEDDDGEQEGQEGEPPAEPATHAAAPGQAMTFRVNGSPITDPALVQAHIDGLEKFRSDQLDSARRDFVTGLVKDNKILANQAPALTDLALSMDEAQFSKFKEGYEGAGVNPLMGSHGRTSADSAPGFSSGPNIDAVQAEIATLEEICKRHRAAGKTEDVIKATSSYRRLTELKSQLNG